MPKIGNSKESHEVLCDRCHSKRRVSKSWTERIKSDNGTVMTLFHTQIICTNKKCQSDFEAELLEENLKREKIKLARDLTKKGIKTP